MAALLSFDLVEVERVMQFYFKDSPSDNTHSLEAECKENIGSYGTWINRVPAKAIHASNDDGLMNNSVWNASCTLEINGDQPKFFARVDTLMQTMPPIQSADSKDATSWKSLSYKTLNEPEKVVDGQLVPATEPIEVLDGQVVAATVILSVD